MRQIQLVVCGLLVLTLAACGGGGGDKTPGGGGSSGGGTTINYRVLNLQSGVVTTSTTLPDLTSADATSTLMVFRRIPAGSFTPGQSASALGFQSDELPPGSPLAISEFWLAVFELTQGQWISLTGDAATVPWRQMSPTEVVGSTATNNKKPAFGMSYDEVVAKMVTWNTGRSISLRLPTTNEWEYACRGGTTTLFYWGDSLDPSVAGQYAVCNDVTKGASGPGLVGGTRISNGLNLWDMHGNVREWTTTTNPSLPVLRGGSWADNLLLSRSANQIKSVDKAFRHALSGARLVLVP